MSKFKPMLASTADTSNLSNVKFPVLASFKLDGIRAIVIDGVVYSRSLKPIPNKQVQQAFGRPEFNGFDGELIVGNPTDLDCYRKSMQVMALDVPDLAVRYFIFDIIDPPDSPFTARYEILKNRLSKIEDKRVVFVETCPIDSEGDLIELESMALVAGYEGLMMRSPDGVYKYGRSTPKQQYLQKLKRFEDAEATVIGYSPLFRNIAEREISELGRSKTTCRKADFEAQDTLGSLSVMYNDIEFEIGSGFDDATRAELWSTRDQLAGKTVKFKFFATGSKERPRFPIFLGFRDPIDQ